MSNEDIANRIVKALTERPVIYQDEDEEYIDREADTIQCVKITKEVLDQCTLPPVGQSCSDGWIPCEIKPPVGELLLLWVGGDVMTSKGYYMKSESGSRYVLFERGVGKPTHYKIIGQPISA